MEFVWLAVYDAVLQSPRPETARALLRWRSVYEVYSTLTSSSSSIVSRAADYISYLEIHVSGPWRDVQEHLEKRSDVGIGDQKLLWLEVKRMTASWLDEYEQQLKTYLGW